VEKMRIGTQKTKRGNKPAKAKRITSRKVHNSKVAHENSTIEPSPQRRMRQDPMQNVQNLQFAHEKQLPRIPNERAISRKVQNFKFDDQKHIT
jgi:hypothetical protein